MSAGRRAGETSERGQSTILDKGRALRTPNLASCPGGTGRRIGVSADRRPGETDRRAGETDRRFGVSAGRRARETGRRNGQSSIKEWGPRNTRKGMRGVGWEAHVTSRDPTLDAVGTRSCAIRRGMSKKRATEIFDLSLRVETDRRFGVSACRRPRETGRRFALRFRNRNRPRFFPVVVLWFG